MKISSKIKDYELCFSDGLLAQGPKALGAMADRRTFYFIDKTFYELYQAPLDRWTGSAPRLLIEPREPYKSYQQLERYYAFLIEAGFTRRDVLVTFGGGILQDISGFIASTLYRGIPWVFVPTTLLAQADSCIGSKTSINFGDSKNLLGTFYPPDLILVDAAFCETLSAEYFNSGLGEMIKFHLLADQTRYQTLRRYLAQEDLRAPQRLREIIVSTLEIKKSYFEEDEFDTGRRNLLNYGHCFGHALESASGFAVCHGEAVIAGMGLANVISRRRGLMREAVYRELEDILQRFYPRYPLAEIPAEKIIAFMKRDKKRVGPGLTMILAHDIGEAHKYDDISEEEMSGAYEDFLNIYPRAVEAGR